MAENSIRILIAICDGFNLVLPANMVADIVSGVNIVAVENPQSWQRGTLNWRDMTVPVVGFEQILNNRQARLRGSHIAVLRGIADTASLPYYGLPTQVMPNEYELESEAEIVQEAARGELHQIACAVRVRGVPCVIPEIARIEKQVAADIRASSQEPVGFNPVLPL